MESFLSAKSLLKAGEHDRPLIDRLWDAAPVYRHRDEKMLKQAKLEEKRAMKELEDMLDF